MDQKKLLKLLTPYYPSDILVSLIDSFFTIIENFALEKWKPAEIDAGHFVESIRRIIELELFHKTITLSENLPKFTNTELIRYENAKGDESLRIYIPRLIYSIYTIRNKRGVAHTGQISANQMDSTLILYAVKWVIAEILRLKLKIPINEGQDLINSIISINIPLIWKDGDEYVILSTKISAANQVLLVLYDNGDKDIEGLISIIKYKNRTNFRSILITLERDKSIVKTKTGFYRITPIGKKIIEELIINHRPNK